MGIGRMAWKSLLYLVSGELETGDRGGGVAARVRDGGWPREGVLEAIPGAAGTEATPRAKTKTFAGAGSGGKSKEQSEGSSSSLPLSERVVGEVDRWDVSSAETYSAGPGTFCETVGEAVRGAPSIDSSGGGTR